MADEKDGSYEAVLADLRVKRDRLNTLIRGLEEQLGYAVGDEGAAAGATLSAPAESAVSERTFLGLSTPLAAEKYLRMMQRPQTTAEIAEALQKGGVHTTSGAFTNTVYTALSRNDKVIRLGRGKWSLREWHPGARTPDGKRKPGADTENANEVDDASTSS